MVPPLCMYVCVHVADHEWGGVWLLDLSLTWHYLSPCFSDYLRLAVIHLGLLQWPYSLTPYGLSPHYEVRHCLDCNASLAYVRI